MKTLITSKFQTTIPKGIRNKMKLSVSDALEWRVERGRIVVLPVRREFLKYKGVIKIGSGDIKKDIETARKQRAERYRP